MSKKFRATDSLSDLTLDIKTTLNKKPGSKVKVRNKTMALKINSNYLDDFRKLHIKWVYKNKETNYLKTNRFYILLLDNLKAYYLKNFSELSYPDKNELNWYKTKPTMSSVPDYHLFKKGSGIEADSLNLTIPLSYYELNAALMHTFRLNRLKKEDAFSFPLFFYVLLEYFKENFDSIKVI